MLILRAARADPAALGRVYAQGTAAERRAVLHALPHLVPGPDALPLVEDALRANDTSLLTAAVGPYAARHLDVHGWRHAVLKCLFTGVPVEAGGRPGRTAPAAMPNWPACSPTTPPNDPPPAAPSPRTCTAYWP
ncbi:hypothetical protein SGLAM104S_10035 [Streptomyces glaucescens]